MKGITIRPLVRSDIPGLQRLVASRETLNATGVSLWVQRMAWIAFENPYADGGPSYFVAEREGQLVGYLGRMSTHLSGHGESFDACYVHDLYVAPVCRSEGLGYPIAMSLYQAVEQATEGLLVGLWTNAVNLQLKKRRGYRILEHAQFVRVLDPRPYVERAVGPRPLRPLATLLARGSLAAIDLLGRALPPRRVEVVTTPRFDAAHDRLVDRLRGRTALRTVPSSKLLNWKYVDLPSADFVRLSANVDGEVAGYVVAKNTAGGAARLVDVQSDPRDRGVMATLCRRAVEELAGRGARSVVCAATDPRLISVLRSLAFFRAPQVLHVAMRKDDSDSAAIHDLRNWHIGFGESDFSMIA